MNQIPPPIDRRQNGSYASRRRLKLFLSFTASAIVLLLWGFLEPEHGLQQAQPEHIREADAYVTGVEIHQYDSSGRLSHSIKGERVRHLPNNGSTLIDQPLMTLYRENKSPISATGLLGELEPNHDTFWLREKVVVYNQIDNRYRLETPYLKITPELELAETDTDVTLYQAIGTTYAIGMTADFANDKLQLHNAVRGHYEPN